MVVETYMSLVALNIRIIKKCYYNLLFMLLTPVIFHLCIVIRACLVEKNYSQSRYHFLHSQDGEGCGTMLVEYHITAGYPSEVDLFVAQAVLQWVVFNYICVLFYSCKCNIVINYVIAMWKIIIIEPASIIKIACVLLLHTLQIEYTVKPLKVTTSVRWPVWSVPN